MSTNASGSVLETSTDNEELPQTKTGSRWRGGNGWDRIY